MNLPVSCVICDLKKTGHCRAFLKLLNAYIADAMGGGEAVRGTRAKKIIADLAAHPARLILFAKVKDAYAGMAVCFLGYSTFLCGPALNIHDMIVLPDYRGKGIGRALMRAIEKRAAARGCARITLEVRRDNAVARNLYAGMNYGECEPPMSFWEKKLSRAEVI